MENLKNFYGTEQYHKGFSNINLTDGVAFLIKNNCSWLISDISVILKSAYCNKEDFVAIKFKLDDDDSCEVIYTDGNNKELYKQNYEYTDFKEHFEEKEITFFYTDNVLLLSGEY